MNTNQTLGELTIARITVRRAIFENFPAGPEREKRLRWFAAVVSGALDSAHGDPQQETTELESRRNRT